MKKQFFTLLACLFAIGGFAQVGVGTTTPNSTLDVRGSIATSYRAFTGNTSAGATDNLLVFTGTSAATVTLPTAVGCDGRSYMIKNASTTGPTPVLTIATTSSQTIDGAASWTLSTANESITLVSNGANWHVTTQGMPSASSNNWTQNGNAVASMKSLGTTSNYSLPFITNNTEWMRLTNTGSLGVGTTAPNSTFDVRGSVSTNYRAFTAATTATASDNLLVFTGSSATTVTLPTAVGCDGRSYVIKNASAGSVLTIATTASQTIEGAASWALSNANETVTLISNGANWQITTAGTPGAVSNSWNQNGNSVASMKSLGTTSNYSLPFVTNNTEWMRLTNTGNLGIATTAPNSTFDVRGSVSTNYRAFTAATTATATDNLLTFTGSSPATLTLPTAVGCDGRSYVVKNASASSVLTIATTSSQTIDGAASWALSTSNESITLTSNGANWQISTAGTPGAANTNWAQNGNAVSAIKTLGTTTNYSLPFVTNNTEWMRLTNTGNLGIATTAPNSTFDVRGSVSTNYRGFTAATTATASDNLLVFTGTTATTVTLPTAVGCDGRSYMIKNASTTGPTPVLTIATTSSQTIDGSASWTLTSAFETVTLISNGANWNIAGQSLPGGSGVSWTQNGNAVASMKTIGTTSNYSLPFITNNTEKMRLTNTGSLGVGTSTFNGTYPEKLLVDAGTTTSVNAIVGKGSIDSYLQLNIQNQSAGANSSSDVVATANNGDETTNYVDMGINGGSNTSGVMGAANDAYLYNIGQNMLLGTGSASKSLVFMTGGTSQATNERMRIDGNGKVGIGLNAIPKANIGIAKFAMEGTNASANGPHLQFTTSSDNYPLAQLLNWQHDNVYQTFDSYYDGAWRSSTSTGGNFVAGKEGGKYLWQYANVNTPGSPITWNNGFVLTNTGKVGVGTATFNATNPEKLVVDAGTTTSVNAIVGKGSIDSYLQLNIQNQSAGTSSSSDVVATANNGDETTNYIDMGINGGNNTNNIMGDANDAYLYNIGQDLLVGTGSANKSLIFMTGGTNQASNERMRIDGNGNVGIGVGTPSYKLHVTAASNPLYLGGVQTGASSDSVVTINNGVVRKLAASALAASNNAWSTTGNASTNPTTNFIGTTDAQALVVKENNTQVARFEANSIALGNGAAVNNATHSYALGSNSSISFGKTQSYAIGHGASATTDNAFAIGNSAVTNGSNSIALGNSAAANNTYSAALGYGATTAYGITDALAMGTNATANASNSVAIGSNTTAANKTVTNAANAIAIGTTAVSNSASSIAIGTNATTAYSITPAVAIGNAAVVNGNSGIAIGNGATVGTVANATAIGAGASVTTTGTNSTAIGYNASATLANEIILGDRSNTSLSVGIGTESFSGTNREKLLVDAGTTSSVNAIVGKGSIDSYLQLNIQNNSAGTSASSDVVATANNGNETSNYIDMGINGGNYSGGVMGAANDGYMYTMGNNFLIGTANASKSLIFMTGGTTQSTNERMRVDGSGNVGIGTNAPTANLHVASAATGNTTIAQFLQPGLTTTNATYLKLGKSLTTGDQADIVYNWTAANSNSNYLGFGFYSKPISMAVTNGGNVGVGTTTPASTLEVNGSQALAITTKTATYTATSSDYTIICNNTGGAITINLPAAAGCSGRVYVIKKISGMFLNVTVDPNGAETIDGSATRVLTSQYESVMIQSNGTSWFILSNS
ncbi:beta strand repeat-containing protein [Ferruginibacter sp.]